MAKTLCDNEKLLKNDFEAYADLVRMPKYICQHCGRAARKKKNLCEPKEIPHFDKT